LNFAENKYIFTADILMTDWSGIAYEFSYCGLRPSIFVNTPMKVLNPNYELYGLEVTDITLRDKVGISVDMNQLGTLGAKVAYLLDNQDAYIEAIEGVVENHLFYPSRSGEAGERYIIDTCCLVKVIIISTVSRLTSLSLIAAFKNCRNCSSFSFLAK